MSGSVDKKRIRDADQEGGRAMTEGEESAFDTTQKADPDPDPPTPLDPPRRPKQKVAEIPRQDDGSGEEAKSTRPKGPRPVSPGGELPLPMALLRSGQESSADSSTHPGAFGKPRVRSQEMRPIPRADLRDKGEQVLAAFREHIDPRTMVFRPKLRVDLDRIEMGGMFQTRSLGEAVRAAVERALPERALSAFYDTPRFPPEFARIKVDGVPVHARARRDSERVTTARRAPGDPEPGALALVLGSSDPPETTKKRARSDDSSSSSEKVDFVLVQLPDGYIGHVEASLCEDVSPANYMAWWQARRDQKREERIAQEARSWLGTPYLWGGCSKGQGAGVDCSGFSQAVYAEATGFNLPRDANQQARFGGPAGVAPAMRDLFPGDLLFFMNERGRIYHVAISLGGADYIHADGERGVILGSFDKRSTDFDQKRADDFLFGRRLWR